MTARPKRIDGTLGNPLYPLRSVASYAFRQASKTLNEYQIMNAGNSETSIRKALITLQDYFSERGLRDLGLREMILTGGGTTEGFNMIVQMLADDIRQEGKRIKKDIKGAILMPVPTYGFFNEAARRQGLEVIPVRRDMKYGGRLNYDVLRQTVRKALKDEIRIVGYYDSNPHNPLGLIRGEEETRRIGELLRALSKKYGEMDQVAQSERLKKFKPVKIGDRMIVPGSAYRWDGPASRVCIIDDMVYDGLEYGTEKGFSFAQVPEFSKDTLALFGPSKAGLASLRAGVVIGGRRYMEELRERFMMNQYFPSRPALHAMEGYFNIKQPFVKQRQDHLDRLNKDHRFNGLLMKALINGMDTMPEVTVEDRRDLVRAVMDHDQQGSVAALARLNRPISGVRIVTTPQAGFFHMLDFSRIKNRIYSNEFVHYKQYWGWTKAKDEQALHEVFNQSQNLAMASGSWTGLDKDDMMVRMTFAVPVADIFDIADRLRRGIKNFVQPSRVPDYKPEPV